jgi:ADP-ribosylglycohydrolase/catechol 2,3-dioxygenase-like lactoylglutathione lyase family enzyme
VPASVQLRRHGIIEAKPMPEHAADIRARAEGALLATAVGDALGWPQEDRGRRTDGSRTPEPKFDFTEWRRRGGGRYASHEESIHPGEYSDDTQLVLAVARARRTGDAWWDRLTQVELPFWLFYERGGGMATKRAARSWASGKAPWHGEHADGYFAAGGNGVTMRVLPHILYGCQGTEFAPVAAAVVKDGTATHGHPNALVGALAYSYALWLALRRERVLAYGALISELYEAADDWSLLPTDLPAGWRDAADAHSNGDYAGAWRKAGASMVNLLGVAAAAMEHGALSVDRETLEALGAFDNRVSGAGTVTAAAAVFLASRYAARPAQGLLAAAFAIGADTDTLAATAGGLLGAINGREWLDVAGRRVQDQRYLVATARAAVSAGAGGEGLKYRPLDSRPRELRTLWRRLGDVTTGAEISLPDGRVGVLERITDLATSTRHTIRVYAIRTDDGQSLFLKKVSRLPRDQGGDKQALAPAAAEISPAVGSGQTIPSTTVRRRAVVAIEAASIKRTVDFYRDLIGLELTRQTSDYVSFGGVLVVVPANGAKPIELQLALDQELFARSPKIIVFVAADDLETLHQQLHRAAVPVTAVRCSEGGGPHRFSCIDPDGTVVEIRQANDGS